MLYFANSILFFFFLLVSIRLKTIKLFQNLSHLQVTWPEVCLPLTHVETAVSQTCECFVILKVILHHYQSL